MARTGWKHIESVESVESGESGDCVPINLDNRLPLCVRRHG